MPDLESTTDLEAFMDLGGKQIHANGVTETAIFEDEYQRTDQFGTLVIETSAPRLTLPTHKSVEMGLEHGDEVIVDDVCYLIKEIKPDGTGMSEIRLIEQ